MPLLETTVAAAGRLALAAAYDDPVLAKMRSQETNEPSRAGKENGSMPRRGSSLPQAAIYTIAGLAWLSERRTLTRRKLDHDAKAAVRFKDLLVAGALITGFANMAVEELIARRYPSESPSGRSSRSVSDRAGEDQRGEAGPYHRYFKVMGPVNRILVAGAVAATPFINFGLFNAYKPHPFRSFFKL